MFRELTRKNKQLSMEDCIRVLEKETRGVLSVLGDEGYPYGMPMNHFYNAEDGKLYFHCGKGASHRLDALRRCNKVSFCAYDRGFQKEGSWPYYVRSVIVFGQVEITEDPALIETITRKLSYKFIRDDAHIDEEIRLHGHRTLLLVLTPAHICGKLVEES